MVDRAGGRLRLVRRPHRGRARRRDRVRQVLDVQRARPASSSPRSAYDVRPRRGRRPAPGAATGADELLDWLGIPPRHQVARDSHARRAPREDRTLDGLVLLDLPDHDSTEVAHHLEVDRLVAAGRPAGVGARPAEVRRRRDPRPLPAAAGRRTATSCSSCSTTSTTVPADRREAMVDDLRRLLAEDGLGGVPVIATSARHGEGIPELNAAIAEQVRGQEGGQGPADGRRARGRRPACSEVNGDAAPRATSPGPASASWSTPSPTRPGCRPWSHAVERSTRRRAAAGHRLAGHLVAQPAQARPAASRLHLDLGRGGKELTGARAGVGARRRPRCSAPASTPPCARLSDDVGRRAVAAVGGRGPPGVGVAAAGPRTTRSTRRSASTDLGRRAHPAVVAGGPRAPVAADGRPRWSAGCGWLVLAVLGYLQISAAGRPGPLRRCRCPRCCCSAGSRSGCCSACSCKAGGRLSARRRARAADRRLRAAIAEVTERAGRRAGRGRGGGLPRHPAPVWPPRCADAGRLRRADAGRSPPASSVPRPGHRRPSTAGVRRARAVVPGDSGGLTGNTT